MVRTIIYLQVKSTPTSKMALPHPSAKMRKFNNGLEPPGRQSLRSLEQSIGRTNSRLLHSPNIQSRDRYSLPLIYFPSQMNPFYTLHRFCKLRSSIILPALRLKFCIHFSSPIRATSPVHLILFDLLILTIFGNGNHIVQFCPDSGHSVSFMSKHFPLLKHSYFILFIQFKRPRSAPIQHVCKVMI
jgi:hypothetical protein